MYVSGRHGTRSFAVYLRVFRDDYYSIDTVVRNVRYRFTFSSSATRGHCARVLRLYDPTVNNSNYRVRSSRFVVYRGRYNDLCPNNSSSINNILLSRFAVAYFICRSPPVDDAVLVVYVHFRDNGERIADGTNVVYRRVQVRFKRGA